MTADEDLAGHMVRIRGVKLQLDAFGNGFAALLHHIGLLVTQGDGRRALGHAVARHERNLELLQEEALQLLRHGRAARDHQAEVAAEGVHEDGAQGFAEVRVVLIVRELGGAALAADEFADGVVDHLVDDERNREEHVRFVVAQGGLEVSRHGRDIEDAEGHAVAERGHQVVHQAEDVGVGEHADVVVLPLVREMVGNQLDVGAEVADGDHHALRVAGGAGGVHQGAELVQRTVLEVDVVGAEPVGVGGGEDRVTLRVDVGEVAAGGQQFAALGVEDAHYLRHGLEVHLLEDRLLRIKDAAVGMGHELHRVRGRETVEELHGHESARLGGEEGLAPACAGAGVDGNLVARLETGGPPPEDGFLEFGGQLTVGDTGLVIFNKCCLVPAGFDGLFKAAQEAVFKGQIVHGSLRYFDNPRRKGRVSRGPAQRVGNGGGKK